MQQDPFYTQMMEKIKSMPNGQEFLTMINSMNNIGQAKNEIEAESSLSRFLKFAKNDVILPEGYMVAFPEEMRQQIKVPESMVNRIIFQNTGGKYIIMESPKGMSVKANVVDTIDIPTMPLM